MQHPTVTKNSFLQRRKRTSVTTAGLGVVAAAWLTVAAGQDVANGTLAAAIRASDHPCDRVIDKERVSASVWRVRCNSGHFQVTLKDSGNPEVVPLD